MANTTSGLSHLAHEDALGKEVLQAEAEKCTLKNMILSDNLIGICDYVVEAVTS